MPAYTLGEIMSQATFRAGRRSDLEASQVSFWANEAYYEVADVAPLASRETLATLSLMSGSGSTALPSDLHELILLSWMSGGSGTTLTLSSIDVIDSMGTCSGIPTHFAFYGGAIEFRPLPESDLTAQLRYRAQISDLTELSSVPSVNTAWRPAIVQKLVEKVLANTGDAEGAALAHQRYLSLIASLKNDDARRQQSLHPASMHVVGYE